MKFAMALLLYSMATAHADEPARDLLAEPLSVEEWGAFNAAQPLAASLGETLVPECVNATYGAYSNPVNVQFMYIDNDGNVSCGDPHYSIEVELDSEGRVVSVDLIDA